MTDNTVIALTVLAGIAIALVTILIVAEIRDMRSVKRTNDDYLRSCAELDAHFATVPKD